MMEEPSVLDYLKSKLNPWRGKKIEIPAQEPGEQPEQPKKIEPTQKTATKPLTWPWRVVLALVFALIAQVCLDRTERIVSAAVVLYGLSAACMIWAVLRGDFEFVSYKQDSTEPLSEIVRPIYVFISLPFMLLAFLSFGKNRFTSFNLTLLGIAFLFFMLGFWLPGHDPAWKRIKERWNGFRENFHFTIVIKPWIVLVMAAVVIALFFRFYRLDQVPGEMFSDHAEKLLDVSDVLNGQFSIFFPRNTGREAIQMYLTAAIALIFKTGLSFISLKIGTVLIGLLTLPYIYFLGKEIGNRWVGLLALLMVAIGYWPNVIARIGLRFPLYPMFAAPTLYYLIRGLRSSNRNDFILSGLALGLGLNGYSPFRLVPFVVVAAVGIYFLHAQSRGKRAQAIWSTLILSLVAFLVFLPLFRYMLSFPEMFNYRALTRLGTTEQNYPGPVGMIFLSNLWKAYIMPFYDNGNVWVNSVVYRPALDVVTAALYFLGLVGLTIRYIRQRHWLDLFLILSVPLLMMPSILSLAFPEENPSLNRASGAIIPIFLIAALALEGVLSALIKRTNRKGLAVSISLVIGLVLSLI
ncbi:MAG: glycosyltransferase family 39 protein, partial [Planctomycetes bacterium]|nr:glycosyltransferase family 39 protein [Planctomycetota bacterium]